MCSFGSLLVNVRQEDFFYTYLKKRRPLQTINDETKKHLGSRTFHFLYANYSCTLEFSLEISTQTFFLKYERTVHIITSICLYFECVKNMLEIELYFSWPRYKSDIPRFRALSIYLNRLVWSVSSYNVVSY
jgi:hypothetical protein